MNIGVIVSFVLGGMFVFLGCRTTIKRNWKKDNIKEWMSEPQTTAKITETVTRRDRDGRYRGYCYYAELLIDGVWYKAQSCDSFRNKPTCEIGEEVTVSYRPIKDTQTRKVLDTAMSVMADTLMNHNWEDVKPRYLFKFVDAQKYDNEEEGGWNGTAIFLIIFGLTIILIGYLSYLGVIE